MLHGITFGLYWSVASAYARRLAPPGLESSLQGVFAGLNSAGAFAGNLLGGRVLEQSGAVALWLGLGAMNVAALALLTGSMAAERAAEGGARRGLPPLGLNVLGGAAGGGGGY